MTTVTIDANKTYCGYIRHNHASWATCQSAATGTDVYTNTTSEVYSRYSTSLSKYYIRRGFLYFDTSSIPDDATITSVKLYMYNYSPYASETYSDICAQKGTQANTFTTADFDSFSGNYYGKVTLVTNEWRYIEFNATGISDINKTGVTKICLRDYDKDYSNSAPPTDDSRYGGIVYNSIDYEPYLEITYTTAVTKFNVLAGGVIG